MENSRTAAARTHTGAPFNSATAVSRGELKLACRASLQAEGLQFGHGCEPWRTPARERERLPDGFPFNSATAVSRGERLDPRFADLARDAFNSATAVSRGERIAQSFVARWNEPSIRPRL